MMRPHTKPAAAMAMGANRATEARERQVVELMQIARDGAMRITELTNALADLQDRVALLEGAGRT